MTDIERLAEVDDMSIAMGYFNWVSMQAMQRLLQGEQETGAENNVGKYILSRRDEDFGRIGRTQEELQLRDAARQCNTTDMVAMDHDMIATRMSVCEVAPRSRTKGSLDIRGEGDGGGLRIAMDQRPARVHNLQKWDKILKGNIQNVDGGRASRAHLDTHDQQRRAMRYSFRHLAPWQLLQSCVGRARPTCTWQSARE